MNKTKPRKYIKIFVMGKCSIYSGKGLFFYMFVNPLDTKSSRYLIINRFEIPPSSLDWVSLWKLIGWWSHPSGMSGHSQWVLITIDTASVESQTLMGCLLGAYSNDLQVNLGDWQFTYNCYSPEEFKTHLCRFPWKQPCDFLSLNTPCCHTLQVQSQANSLFSKLCNIHLFQKARSLSREVQETLAISLLWSKNHVSLTLMWPHVGTWHIYERQKVENGLPRWR